MNFQDTVSPKTQIICIDEFSAGTYLQLKANVGYKALTRMCDGEYEFNRKGITACVVGNPIIIILSNFSPQEVFGEISPEFAVRY